MPRKIIPQVNPVPEQAMGTSAMSTLAMPEATGTDTQLNMPPAQKAPLPSDFRQEGPQRTPIAQGVNQAANNLAPPEDQRLYEAFVRAGMQVINHPKTRDAIVKMLQSGRPQDALSHATVQVVQLVERDAKSKGIEFPDQVIAAAGMELMAHLELIGKAAGIFKDLTKGQGLEAIYSGVDQYMADKAMQQDLDLTGIDKIAPQFADSAAQKGLIKGQQPEEEMQ